MGLGEHFEGEGRLRGRGDGGGDQGLVFVVLEVGEVDGGFVAAGEDGHDAGGGAGVQEGQEVVHGAQADVVAQGGEGVDAFVGFWTGGGGVSTGSSVVRG